ncbi:hypothetical protein GS831_15280 [Rhodococcus hoagii]|nr:hypothetical protein [Prescottella equi]
MIGDAAIAPPSRRSRPSRTNWADLPSPRAATCHREHLEMVTPEQAALLGSWGVIASMQPVFDALWGGTEACTRSASAPSGPRV